MLTPAWKRRLKVLTAVIVAALVCRGVYVCQPLMNFVWMTSAAFCQALHRPSLFIPLGLAQLGLIAGCVCGLLWFAWSRVRRFLGQLKR